MRYNHMYDIAFALETDQEDPYEVSEQEIARAIIKRVQSLLANSPEILEAIGHCDTYEVP